MGEAKAVRLYDLFSKEYPKQPCYISNNVLRKGSTLLLGGEAKCGKSFVSVEALRALSTGTAFMGNPDFAVEQPVKCLYIEMENGEETTVERAKTVYKDEDKRVYENLVYLISKDLNCHFNDSTGYRYIETIVQDIKPNVLILDPISFMYHKDENSSTDVGQLYYKLAQLKEVGKAEGLSIVMSHHFGKRPWGKNAQGWDELSEYNFRGSSKWKDGGDSLITMFRFNNHFVYDPEGVKNEAWDLRMRFLTRHGSSPPQGVYNFNDGLDLRVKYKEDDQKKELRKLKLKELAPMPMEQPMLEGLKAL